MWWYSTQLDIFLGKKKKREKKVESQIRDSNVKQQAGRGRAFYLVLSWTIWQFLCALVCFAFVETMMLAWRWKYINCKELKLNVVRRRQIIWGVEKHVLCALEKELPKWHSWGQMIHSLVLNEFYFPQTKPKDDPKLEPTLIQPGDEAEQSFITSLATCKEEKRTNWK